MMLAGVAGLKFNESFLLILQKWHYIIRNFLDDKKGDQMIMTARIRVVSMSLGIGFIVCGGMLYAQETLGPMAGTGGVMRDAERRALAPLPTKEAGKASPSVQTDASAAPQDESSKATLGVIETVKVFGSVEFAEREELSAKILMALGEGGEKTMGDVKAALAAVRQDFVDRGFYLVRIALARSAAYNPETKTLSVLVDEGRFGRLTIRFGEEEDGTWYSRDQILSRFRAVQEGETFDYSKLRTALFEANSHPDITIDTSIDVRKPIEGEGDDRRISRYADVNLDVRESFPFHIVWEVNNYGMEEVEEWQTSLTMQYLNLTKHDDVLTISPSMSFGAELMSVAASYMLPHHWWKGGNTTLYGGWSQLDVDDIVSRLDLEGAGWFVGLQHSEYLYDDDRHLWALSAGVLWRYIEDQYTALGQKLNKRDAAIMPLSLALSYTGRKADFLGGRNFATVQGLFNPCSSGDDLDEMWTDAEDNYWILRWQLARLQPLFGWFDEKTKKDLHQWILFLKLEGQYTTENLIPVEKLSMGGYNCMRGYRTRGYLGDYGVYGTAELRTPILVDAMSSCFSDRTDKNPLDRLQFVGFLDYGWTSYNDLPAGYSDDSEFLFSAGFGVRTAITKYTQLKCDVAFPLRDTDWADDDSMEVYLSVQVQF